MRTRIASLLLLLGLAGCAIPPNLQVAPAPVPTAAPLPLGPAAAALTAPSRPAIRADLGHQWFDREGHVRYPPHEGFAGPAVFVVLPAGVLLDRFGAETGNYFSPKGAPHRMRALPSVCAVQSYAVYRVRTPLTVWAGTAAPWFGEPGGATQLKTDAPAAMLVGDGVLEHVPDLRTPPCS